MRYLLFIPLFFIMTSISYANNNSLSYDEYISQYGKDATSIAIIDVFFENNSNMETALISPTEEEYSNKNLIKALKNYQKKNRIASTLIEKVNKKMEAKHGITNDGYNNLMNATLKKMDQE